jgi:hypothetical protein
MVGGIEELTMSKLEDRDGDGIPDIYDTDPDTPAQNAYELHLQDKRNAWKGPSNDVQQAVEIRKCLRCNNSVHSGEMLQYGRERLCIPCWREIQPQILNARIAEVQAIEKTTLSDTHLKLQDLTSKIPPLIDGHIYSRKKIKFSHHLTAENATYPVDFSISLKEAARIIFLRIFESDSSPLWIKYFTSSLHIEVRRFTKSDQKLTGRLHIHGSGCELRWDAELKLQTNTLNNILRGFAHPKLFELFPYIVLILFAAEIDMFFNRLRWADQYLRCGDLKEAEILYRELGFKMDPELRKKLDGFIARCIKEEADRIQNPISVQKINIEKSSPKKTQSDPVNLKKEEESPLFCPFCFQQFLAVPPFLEHVKNHQTTFR